MRISRPWRIAAAGAGAAALIAGLGGAAVASDRIDLQDKVSPIQVSTQYDDGSAAGSDDSAGSVESADSPHASPFDSTDSPAGAADTSPESADSPNASAADSPFAPAKPVTKPAAGGDSANSADSPNPPTRKAPASKATGDDSAASAASAGSPSSSSADSAD